MWPVVLKLTVENFRNWELAIVQYPPEKPNLSAFKSFFSQPRCFPSRGISFHYKDDPIGHLAEQDRVPTGADWRRVDQDVLEFFS